MNFMLFLECVQDFFLLKCSAVLFGFRDLLSSLIHSQTYQREDLLLVLSKLFCQPHSFMVIEVNHLVTVFTL